jgi:hypothetical protein
METRIVSVAEDLDVSPAADFQISEDMAMAEVGPAHLRKVKQLAMRLYGERRLSFRLAPSIVVRGEAELFGLSMPRFACRIYLRSQKDSFVNIRRLEQLRASLAHHLDENSSTDAHPGGALRELLGKIGNSSNCCADSLLLPPADLIKAGYYILTTDLEPIPKPLLHGG